ncbi:MAG TPA: hypothetical protein VFO73_11540 [Candidatus Limnocylindrales bacterium]|nr:hypothetical protein [Candidatus Limnocylindrales bacterium]
MTGRERDIPAPKANRGMQETDDHVAATAPRGSHQPAGGLDRGVGDEHVSSPFQGVRPVEGERTDDEAAGGGPSGEEDAGSGPAFEPER